MPTPARPTMEALMSSRFWILALAAAGCGGDARSPKPNAAQAGAAIPAACQLLTGDEVAAILGETVRAEQTDVGGTWAEGSGTSICNYYTQGMNVAISFTAIRPVSPAKNSGDLADAMRSDNKKTGLPVTAAEPVAGLGDAAARWQWEPEAKGAHYLVANKGSVRLLATATSHDAARAMVDKALSRLP